MVKAMDISHVYHYSKYLFFMIQYWIEITYSQPPKHEFISTFEPSFGAEGRGLPGDVHEFKFNIDAGRQECLYQKLKSGANLHLAFEVMKGSDRNLDFVIFDPEGEILDKHLWKSQGVTDRPIQKEGVYGFCMDNTFSRFSPKLVYFFLSTYVPEQWKKYTEDLQKFDLSVHNFTEFMSQIDSYVGTMGQLQAVSRQHAVTDWYIIKNSNNYIERWSVLMCVVIMFTSALQTYFVRRLFSAHKVTPDSRTTVGNNALLNMSA